MEGWLEWNALKTIEAWHHGVSIHMQAKQLRRQTSRDGVQSREANFSPALFFATTKLAVKPADGSFQLPQRGRFSFLKGVATEPEMCLFLRWEQPFLRSQWLVAVSSEMLS